MNDLLTDNFSDTYYCNFINKLKTTCAITPMHYVVYDKYVPQDRLDSVISSLNTNKIPYVDLYTHIPPLYDNLKNNQHHWTTEYCWNTIIPKIVSDLRLSEFDETKF